MHFIQTLNFSVIFLYCNLICLALIWGSAYGVDAAADDKVVNDDLVINLPESHLPYYFNKFPKVIEQCLSNSSCIYRTLLENADYDRKKCWGYEPHCEMEHAFSKPKCADEKPVWIKTYDEYNKTFYYQADFGEFYRFLLPFKLIFVTVDFLFYIDFFNLFPGYIRTQINELMVLCTPLFPNDSMLECTKNFRFCHGRNIMINFTDLAEKKQPWRYEMDVLKKGQIGRPAVFAFDEKSQSEF